MGVVSALKYLLIGGVFIVFVVPQLMAVLLPSYQDNISTSNVPFSSLTLGAFALTGFVLVIGIFRRFLDRTKEPRGPGYDIGGIR